GEKNLPDARARLDECPQDQRHWEWFYLRQQANGEDPVSLEFTTDITSLAVGPLPAGGPFDPHGLPGPAWSARFSLAVVCGAEEANSRVHKRPIDGDQLIPMPFDPRGVFAFGSPTTRVAVNRDGSRVAAWYSGDTLVYLYNDTGRQVGGSLPGSGAIAFGGS